MPIIRVFTCLAVLAALLPAPAAAAVKLVVRDEPVSAASRADGTLMSRAAPLRFNMVGLHWKGSGTVWFRTALEAGEWSEWRAAQPEAEDAPDPGSPESARRLGWKLGNPYWTGPARYIDYRMAGQVTRLRTHFLRSEATEDRTVAARASAPTIIRRAQWGADESIVRAPPWYAERVRLAIVHHTAGTNDYSAAQSAAIVRGIHVYHVLGNGWNDIGYNFLVDKYGQVFEGRAGGIDQPVGGAHAAGFNTGSTGIAVLGTYSTRDITSAARSALVKLISWRLDVAHVDPLTKLNFVSFGSDRFPAGTTVRLRAVSGHRDTASTSCPGNILYGRLDSIAKSAAARGLPKLYEPVVTGSLGGFVRITGRLSSALPWTVKVRDSAGHVVASGSETGAAVDWTWDASAVFFGDFTYEITAPDVRPASGRVPGPPPLAVRSLARSPRVLTPNADGVGETMKISFSLTTGATVTASVLDAAGTVVARPVNDRFLGAGPFTTSWSGTVADGLYTLRVEARSPAQQASAQKSFVVDRTLGFLTVTPAFSPNGDGRLDLAGIGFTLARPADVRAAVRSGSEEVAEIASAPLGAGDQSLTWDGVAASGRRPPDGVYTVVARATTSLGTRTLKKSFALDTRAPAVEILSARYSRGITSVRFSLSEPATVRLRLGDLVVRKERAAGTFTISRAVRAERVRIKAWDAAANIGRDAARVR
jgi:flagellar hook assembly protein FlgD